jgi:hypothetical protein
VVLARFERTCRKFSARAAGIFRFLSENHQYALKNNRFDAAKSFFLSKQKI